jgi:glycosyltransferase involved in cell wall biosynthesis
MKILHLASGNRWTGAAAPAFAEVEALRMAGIDAHYAYVGGYKLEEKIRQHDFAHPLIEKAQNPISLARSVAGIGRLVRHLGFDILHAHLTYDHWLARLVARKHDVRIARTIHARRVLRGDPFSRSMFGRTDILCAVNESLLAHPLLLNREVLFTPPAVDHRQFSHAGPNVRATYGIPMDAKVVTVIGKLSKGRGFEEALQTFAILRRTVDTRMMIIGHGEHRPALEELVHELGVTDHVLWAGYHEDDLAEHYRASDLLLFTAPGSDEGHRAILEAMACGVVPAAFPIEGVLALIGPELVAAEASPEALASLAASLFARDLAPLRRQAIERSLDFSYPNAARRLIDAYRVSLGVRGGSDRERQRFPVV